MSPLCGSKLKCASMISKCNFSDSDFLLFLVSSSEQYDKYLVRTEFWFTTTWGQGKPQLRWVTGMNTQSMSMNLQYIQAQKYFLCITYEEHLSPTASQLIHQYLQASSWHSFSASSKRTLEAALCYFLATVSRSVPDTPRTHSKSTASTKEPLLYFFSSQSFQSY